MMKSRYFGMMWKRITAAGLLFLVCAGQQAFAQSYSTVQFIDANTAVAAGSQVVRSNDGGQSWTIQPTGTTNNFFGLWFTSASTGTIVGGMLATATPAALRTVNSGSSWTAQTTGATNLLQGVYFIDANTGYAVGRSGIIIKTTNGGTTWTSQSSGTTQTLYKVWFTDANNGTAVGSNGVILHTTNGGASWGAVASGTTAYFYGISFSSPLVGTIVGNAGTILRTVNGGSSWSIQATGKTYDLRSVSCIDDNTIMTAGTFGTILRSVNGGSSWTTQTSGTTVEFGGIAFASSSIGVAVGASATILRTSDGGSTWSPASVSSGGSAPGTPLLASPADGSTGQPTTVTLSWNASAGAATYRVQASTSTSFTSLVVDDSTLSATSRSVAGLLNSTTYYWRVNAKNAYGTSAWSTPWSFVTAAAVPGAFALVSPTNAATGQAVSGTLSWQASSNATGYDVYLDGNNPPTTVVSLSQAGTSYNYAGLANGSTYYWKVVAKNAAGSTTATGAPWNFGTIVAPPGAFSLSSPANAATGVAVSGTLSWAASTGATSYDVYFGTVNPPTTIVSPSQAATSYSYAGLTNSATYYWKVVAKNAGGSTTSTAAPWNFVTVAAAPNAFNLLSPANAAADQPVAGTLSWAAATGATSYDVYLGTTNPPTTVVSTSQAGTSYNYAGLANGSTYFWKVVAKNAGGATTSTAAPWNFTTVVAAPGAFSLLSPASGATSQAVSGTLSWAAATGAASYDVYLGTSNPPTTIVSTSQAGTTYSYAGLANSSTYYWKVVAKNAGGSTTSSLSPWNFATVAGAPGAFSLSTPTNGAAGQAVAGTLSWTAASGASGYDVYLDGTNPPTTLVSSNQAGTSYGYSGLANSSTYYWKVVARNAGGTTAATGSPWSFGTVIAAPGTFALLSPANGATGQALAGTLSWQASTNAASYDVYLGTANPPTTIVSTSQIGTSFAYSGLANGATYFWKVVAKNAGGSTTSSLSPWSFATVTAAPGAFALLSPSTGATGQPLAGTLSWQASTGAASYDVYLDGSNPPTTIVSTSQAGTSYNYTGLLNGSVYYWKVVAKNSGGSTTATGAPWNFATVIAAPGAFNLLSPANNATGQAVSGTLSWQAASNATGYDVYLGGTNPPTTLVSTNQAGLSYSYAGLNNSSTYYWKVVAKNAGGSTTATGAPWNFGTVVGPPPTPVLAAPASASTGLATSLTLFWNASANATSYRLQVGTDSTFATGKVVDDSTVTLVSRLVSSLANNTKYFWRVNAKGAGGTSTFSSAWNFTTIPSLPTVLTTAATSVTSGSGVANGTVNPNGVATTAWFEWGTSSTLSTYTSTTTQSVGSGIVAAAVSASLGSLSPNTTYYYRIAAQNSAGTQRDGILSFTTAAVPPTVATAAAGSVTTSAATLNGSANPNGASTTAWFEWGTSSTLATFSTTVSQAVGSGTTAANVSANLSGLAAGTTYYFRAAAQNIAGTQRGNILNFATPASLPAPPAAPTLTSPATGATGQATTLTLAWSASSGASTYRLQVSASSAFTTLVLDDSTLATTSRQVSGLANNATYYWRVSASNAGGTSAYSTVWSFTTIIAAPGAFSLSSPANGATGQLTSGTLSWQAAANATAYDVYLGATNPPTTIVSPNQAGTSYSYAGLSTGTTYFWKVVAKNAGGSVTASGSPWSFTTSSNAPTVATSAPTSVNATGAVANGTVNPNGAATSAWFEWGTSPTLSTYNTTVSQSAGSGTSAVALSANLFGLASNTVFYYRIAAQNTGGIQRGSIVSFTTVSSWTLTGASQNPASGVALVITPLDKNGLGNGTTPLSRSYDNGTSVSMTAPATAGGNVFQKWQRDGVDYSVNATISVLMDAQHTLTAVYVLAPPPAVTLLSPANGSTGLSTSSTLSWNAAAGAVTYRLQVSTSATFASIFLEDSTLTATSRLVSGLSGATTYYWRVSASNTSGSGPWSAQWSFATKRGGKIKITATRLNFGTVPLGTSKKDSFGITNVGDTTVNITGVSSTDAIFNVTESGTPVAPGDTLLIYVSASPQTVAATVAWVIVSYDGGLPSDSVVAQVDSVTVVAGVGDGGGTLPAEFALYQNYPNPFNPTTKIRYQIVAESDVSLIVYNSFGQQVAVLVDGVQSAGVHEVAFDGTNLSSGVYFYKIRAGSDTAVKKLTLMK